MRSRHPSWVPGPRGPGDSRPDGAARRAYLRRRKKYLVLMSVCLALFVGGWALVRLWSVPVAIGMCVVAMVIPPVAAIVGNRRGPDDRWWDEPQDGPPGEGPPGEGPTGAPPGDDPFRSGP